MKKILLKFFKAVNFFFQIKYFLLINCGGNIDFDILEADEDSIFFIVDR